jgi:hypothetical protein
MKAQQFIKVIAEIVVNSSIVARFSFRVTSQGSARQSATYSYTKRSSAAENIIFFNLKDQENNTGFRNVEIYEM